MNIELKTRAGSHAVKMLWLLTGMGLLLAAVAVYSGFYRANLNQVWMETSTEENESWHALHSAFESFQTSVIRESDRVLTGEMRGQSRIEEAFRDFTSEPKFKTSNFFWRDGKRLTSLATRGMELHARALSWRETQEVIVGRILSLQKSCVELLRDARAYMTTQEGTWRLEALADSAKRRESSFEASLRAMAEAREDINTLELLVERLNGVLTIDAFFDLRDNHFAPALQRLGRNFERMETAAPSMTKVLGQLHAPLSKLLMAEPASPEDLLKSKSGGALLPYIQARIQQSSALLELSNDLQTWSTECTLELTDLEKAVAATVAQGQKATNEKMLFAEKTVGWVSLAATLAFLGLAFVISRSIGRQIALTEQANASLQANARSLEENNARLKEASIAAQSAAKAKAEFLANMSHEMRTPLHAVIGLSSVLIETNLTNEQRDYTRSVKCSAEALLSVIDDVLDMSKIESGEMMVMNAPFDLASILDESTSILSVRIREKKLKLVQTYEPGVPRDVSGDAPRLRQILINLLGNAVKFTEAGTIHLIVSIHRKDDNHAWIRFDVVDTGCGIDPATQARLFQSFEQGDTSGSRRYGGTGLGLAISRQLCELMDGEMGLESTPGKGSRFWFTVRVAKIAQSVRELVIPIAPNRLTQHLPVRINNKRLDRLLSLLSGSESERFCEAASLFAGDGHVLLKVVQDAVRQGNCKEIYRGAYGLKGMASEIGADALCQIATNLCELARQSRVNEAATLIQSLLAEFQGVEHFLKHPPRIASTRRLERTTPVESRLRRILVVDDLEMNRKVTATILRVCGFDADLASNGAEAVEKATHNDYDAIIMDLMMPVMNGEDAARAIRKLSSARGRVPILALTASVLESEHSRCHEAGMNEVLSKPISKDKLLTALEKYVTAPVA